MKTIDVVDITAILQLLFHDWLLLSIIAVGEANEMLPYHLTQQATKTKPSTETATATATAITAKTATTATTAAYSSNNSNNSTEQSSN